MHQCVKNCSIKRKQIINPNNTAKCWWSRECSVNKSRNRLFHYIWKESGRPSTGVVYKCYKLAKKNYRRACRQAINNHSKGRFLQIDKLHKARNPKKMWNCIKLTKKQNVNYDAISLKQLENHYLTKFGATGPSTTTVEEADFRVRQKYALSKSDRKSDNFNFSNFQVVKYIKMLKSGSAPGLDGITSEHLKFA